MRIETLAVALALWLPSSTALAQERQVPAWEQIVNEGVGRFQKAGSRELHPFAGAPAQPFAVSPFQAGPLTGADQQLVDLIAKTMPAVAFVEASDGVGTGFIIDPAGYVMTNAHVVDAHEIGDSVDVSFSDKKKTKAKILAAGDKKRRGKDMAILKLEGDKKDWPALAFDDGSGAAPGRFALALGNPEGFKFSSSNGIVSGIDRHFEDSVMSFVQTSAAINPGNSGGPLINLAGKVLGMNTQIVTKGGGSEGLGFAITAADCVRGWEQFKRTETLEDGYIGANLLPGKDKPIVTIESLASGGPAKLAGLKTADKLLEVDSVVIQGEDGDDALRAALHALAFRSPGESVPIVVERNHVRTELSLKVGKWPKPKSSRAVVAATELQDGPLSASRAEAGLTSL